MNKPAPIVQRRLAAIFCADVAGYARLMNADEVGTLRLLTSHRDMTDRLIGQHAGRIANTAGDSILAEFPSGIDALQCALGIQERVAAANEEVPHERRLTFRIGVHVGEAMIRDGDMFGDGVNVAARMQGLAEPGSVCLSGTAHDYVHRLLPLIFEDLGLQQVKNLDTPIRAYLVRPSGQPLSRAIPSIHRGVLFHLLRRTQDVCITAVRDITDPEGLINIDLAVLASLDDVPGLEANRIAERIGVKPAKCRLAIRRLVQRDLIAEVPRYSTRGSLPLILTEGGAKLQRRLHQAIIAAQDRVFAALSEPERKVLTDMLSRVIKANELGSRNSDAIGSKVNNSE
jgi:adenylate cyclase